MKQDLEILKGAIKDISNQLSIIESARESVNEAKKAIKEKFKDSSDVDVTQLNTLIKLYHKQNSSEYFDEQSELENVYHKIFES